MTASVSVWGPTPGATTRKPSLRSGSRDGEYPVDRCPDGYSRCSQLQRCRSPHRNGRRVLDWRWGVSPAEYDSPQGAVQCLLFQGFIANPGEVAQRAGYRPCQSVENLVSALFRRYGQHAAGLLEGQFALLLWDPYTKCLLAVTDALGSIGLHYRTRPGRIRFALDVESLLDDEAAGKPRFNERAAALMLSGFGPPPSETFHEDIYRVEPASTLIFRQDSVTRSRYWSLSAEPPLKLRDDREYAILLEDILDTLGRGYCRGGKPSLLLSGGLDSAVVATTLARQYPAGAVLSLTSQPEDEHDNDERQCAAAAARMLGFDNRLVRYPVHTLFDVDAGLALGPSYPLYGHRFLSRALLAAQQHEGIRISFSGDGGDHLFPDPAYCIADDIATGRWPDAWRQASNLARAGVSRTRLARRVGAALARGVSPSLVPGLPAFASWTSRRAADLGAALLEACLDPVSVRTLPGRAHHLWRLTNPNLSFLLQARASLTTRSGISYRYPLLDRRMFDFFSRLPSSQLHQGPRTKRIFRDLLVGRLPRAVVERPKTAHGNLFDKALRENAAALRSLARNCRLADAGLIDEANLRRTVDSYLSQDTAGIPARLVTTLVYEDWLRRYF